VDKDEITRDSILQDRLKKLEVGVKTVKTIVPGGVRPRR
jgi:hypothetical protein